MRRADLRPALLLAALLAAPLAAMACDPAEMEKAMTEICTAAVDAAGEVVLAAGEPASLAARLAAARRQCAEGDPAQAAAEAIRITRAAALIEARAHQS
ncbi:MAG: hypothetical protein K2X11_16385 [Acetobacteraceae bacterium]|nr:hypothetical protein [Acetobacteraceae bacterium]